MIEKEEREREFENNDEISVSVISDCGEGRLQVVNGFDQEREDKREEIDREIIEWLMSEEGRSESIGNESID